MVAERRHQLQAAEGQGLRQAQLAAPAARGRGMRSRLNPQTTRTALRSNGEELAELEDVVKDVAKHTGWEEEDQSKAWEGLKASCSPTEDAFMRAGGAEVRCGRTLLLRRACRCPASLECEPSPGRCRAAAFWQEVQWRPKSLGKEATSRESCKGIQKPVKNLTHLQVECDELGRLPGRPASRGRLTSGSSPSPAVCRNRLFRNLSRESPAGNLVCVCVYVCVCVCVCVRSFKHCASHEPGIQPASHTCTACIIFLCMCAYADRICRGMCMHTRTSFSHWHAK